MRLKGDDVESGLRDWVKSELKEGPRQGYDLGKFFFSVSVGTIGILVTIEKLNTNAALDAPMLIACILLFLSAVVGLDLVRPRQHSIGGDTDLLQAYEDQIRSVRIHIWIWFPIWVIGSLIGGYAVRT